MSESSSSIGCIKSVDPLWMAMSQYRRRRFKSSITSCDSIINQNGPDVAALFLKTRAVTMESYVDDADFQDEEGAGEMIMDENSTATVPRPGTSLSGGGAAGRGGGDGSSSTSLRPMSSSGRPLTGFVRPGSSRQVVSNGAGGGPGNTAGGSRSLENVLRPGTSRPSTTLGREVRMTTASIEVNGNQINTKKLNMQTIAQKPSLALAIAEQLLYLEADPKRLLELGAECSKANGFRDWWWKYMIGKAYFKLGMLREAERQLKSSIENQSMVVTHLELMKVFLKLDIPKTALKFLYEACLCHNHEPRLLLAIARIHDELGQHEKAASFYKKALYLDAASVEAIACLAAHHYYVSQPEVSLRYYRRLIQMGVDVAEVWSNIGLCCFYSSQFDLSLSCLERALQQTNTSSDNDEVLSDIWFNIGQVSIGIGDMKLAYQAFKISTSINPNHGESFSNLSVLELYQNGNEEVSSSHRAMALKLSPYLFEPYYNGALAAFKQGKFSKSFQLVGSSLGANPVHAESLELLKLLDQVVTVL